MRSRSTTLAAFGAPLLVAAAAQASFLGIFVEVDPYALDGVTPLSSLGLGDVTVYNVYAVFDHPLDQCVGVFGSPDSPFNVFTCNDLNFYNSPAGTDRPPTVAQAAAFPDLNADSFMTIGNRFLDAGPAWPSGAPFSDHVIIAPGTPGPDESPWGGGNENMAWTCRPTLPDPGDGKEVFTPQTLAHNWPTRAIMIMRLGVPQGTDAFGTVGLALFQVGQPANALQVTFFASSSGAFGACCIGLDRCIGCTTPVICTALGGEFLGFGSNCPTQEIQKDIPENGTVFTHIINVPADCTDDAGGQAACEEGPLLDAWVSPAHGLMCHHFGVTGSPPIPAGFFNDGSDPYLGVVCLSGEPLGPLFFPGYGLADFGEVDTLIERTSDPFDPCQIAPVFPIGPVNVGVKLNALSMKSNTPILVSYGGADPEAWNVTVSKSAVYDDGDPTNDPPLGTLSATKTHANGGTFVSTLFVQPRFTFRKADDPTQIRVLDTGLEGIPPVLLDGTETSQSWVHQVNSAFAGPSPFCTAFHPGISGIDQLVVDCNGNGVRDDCEIDDGLADDCDGNGVPDDCQPDAPSCTCPADLDQNGEVAVGDLVILITSWGVCPPPCNADLDQNGEVDVSDLVALVTSWGACE